MAGLLEFKIAAKAEEFDQIHRLGYEAFVEEIPRYEPNSSMELVDRFAGESVYIICLRNGGLLGMLSILEKRPFSLDGKLDDLDSYLPQADSMCEMRLLTVRKTDRHSRVVYGLFKTAAHYCLDKGHDIAVISGILAQQKLYRHLGFRPFGPIVGTPEASFQPMYLTPAAHAGSRTSFAAMADTETSADRTNLMPGPVAIAKTVRDAFNKPAISHRSKKFLAIHNETRKLLSGLVNSKYVEIFMGSGTLANDIIAGQLSVNRGKGLILSNGEFGERLVCCADRFGIEFETLRKDWGQEIAPDDVGQAMDRHPDIKWLWAVHCETSTGMLNDIEMLKDICGAGNISLCLDCVSSIGNITVDLQNVYMASGVSGKGLRSYSGLSMVFYDREIMQTSETLPQYLDLNIYAKKQGVPFTVCSNLVYALRAALRNCDIAERFEKTSSLASWLRNELRLIGTDLVVPDKDAIPSVVTISLPKRLSSEDIGEQLAGKGFLLSYQSEYLAKRNWLQICLMGDYPRENIRSLVSHLQFIILRS